jgi:Flp pilus assembly protein TadG
MCLAYQRMVRIRSRGRISRRGIERDTLAMLRNLAARFRRNISGFCVAERGATAVEFALIAPAFLATLFAVIQTTLFLFAQSALQSAANEAGRLFMTGNAQNLTQSQFEATVCPMVSALFTCGNLMVNVAAYSSFSSASTSAPTLTCNANGSVSNSWAYSPGTQGEIMVVQLIYQWPIVGMPLGSVLPDSACGSVEMMGVTAFRVEPY